MIRLLSVLLFLHVFALHSSIAAMETLSWSMVLLVVAFKVTQKRPFHWPLAWPLLGLVAVSGLSLLVNPGVKPWAMQMGFMRWVLVLWGLFWTFEIVWNEEFERRLIQVWVVALSVAGVYAITQCLTGVNWFHPSANLDQINGVYRAIGFFSMTLTFAYVMGISFFAILLPSFKLGRVWFLAALFFGVLADASSLSRGAWIGLIGAGLIGVTLLARRYLPYFVGVTVAWLIIFIQYDPRIKEIFHLRLETNASIRLNLWRAYGQMFLDHPFTGVGLFQGDNSLLEYYQKLGIQETFVSHAHNVLVQWAAGTGVLGLALYLFLCGWFLRAAWQLRVSSAWGWSLFIAQIFWHLGSLTEANFFDGEVNHMIVFTWALVLFLSLRAKAGAAVPSAN